jgi:penicillin G amidase
MIKALLATVATLLLLTLGTLYLLFLPSHATSLTFEQQTIRIQRDSYSIPHIYAEDRKGFLYAWGYVMAEDRLFQCAFLRLFTQGRLS